METEQEVIKRIYAFIDGRTDRMTYEDSIAWLQQMELERPTQEDLGKDATGKLIAFQND